MRIVQLNTYCGSGSTGRIAVDIAEYAGRQNAETIIGFGTGTVPPDAEVYALRIGAKLGRKWHGAIRKLLDAEGYGSARATRQLIRFLKAYQPDVIHLHNIHGCYLNHRLLFAYLRTAGVPVLWTLHDCWPFTGHCAYFDYVHCDRWQSECHHCPQQRSYPTNFGLDGSRRNYHQKQRLFTGLPALTLVAPCEWMRDIVALSYLSQVPCRVVYNGVNRDVFHPKESRIREKYGITQPYLALAVASEWEDRKGYQTLTTIAEQLGDDVRLVVLGLTPAQIDALPDFMLKLPRTASTRELAQWYSAADCLVNPTLEDNMPLVNLESLACGTPVAVFRTGGCPECITDACGKVVPQGDVTALVEAVRTLCAQKPTMQTACLAQAERFDANSCAQAYWALYQEVCP